MEADITALIEKIDDMGGAIAAIETGFIQKEIESRAYAIQKEIEQKKRVLVGVNAYQIEEKDLGMALFKTDPELVRRQIEKLRRVRESRDGAACRAALDAVRKAAEGDANLMPRFIDAVKAYATLGEICGVLREVFGEYHQHHTVGR
jgi:methylmalonyl-CoA mutase N-terminal domain/subunit